MLRAASLAYSVFIFLLVGVFCYMMVLAFSFNLDLNNHFDLRRKLMLQNQSAEAYAKANFKTLNFSEQLRLFPEEGIETFFKKEPWGLFDKLTILSFLKKDSIRQDFLVSNKRHKETPALYVRDNDEEFKISGKTHIQGTIFISGRGLKKIDIEGNHSMEKPIHNGNIKSSPKTFPKHSELVLDYPENYELLYLKEIGEDTIIQEFDKITRVIEIDTKLENLKLKGNIILRSKDTITVSSTAILEDVIIDAPKVIFQNGFKGNVQVFASKEVIVESHASLKYPSVIVVGSSYVSEKSIVFEEGASLSGLIFMQGNGLSLEKQHTVIIKDKAELTGEVYCNGTLSLYGTVHGSVFTSALLHKTNIATYKNLIYNGQIIANKVPDNFFQKPILQEFETEEMLFVKKI